MPTDSVIRHKNTLKKKKQNMKRARVSEVWNYYKVDSEEKKIAKCNICQTKLSFKGTVSNLNKHLKNKHLITAPVISSKIRQQEPEINPARPPIIVLGTETEASCDSQQACASTSADAVAPSGSSQSAAIPTTQITYEQPFNRIQSTMKMFTNSKKLSIKQRKEIDDALMLLYNKTFLPFSIVEDQYFNNFISKLNPAYQLPSRKHVSNNMLDADYHNCATEIREKLAGVDSACLTIDCWTSRAQEGYLSVTAHYIDDNFTLQTALLQCRVLSGPHTSANLSAELNEVIGAWNLNNKIKLVVSDNAHNVQNCIRDLNLKNFGCFAHTINLIAKDALKIPEIENFLAKLFYHFRRSNTAVEKLLKYQLNNNIKNPKKMIIDVTTDTMIIEFHLGTLRSTCSKEHYY